MKTSTYFQQFKTNFFRGIKIGVAPIFLINILLVLILSIGFASAMWDVELFDGVLISLIFITPFIIVTILGIALISAIISSNKKFSNTPAYILGALIGTVIMANGNAISIYFGLMSFEFTSLPSIITIVLLAYVGSKMNGQANLEAETKLTKTELRTVLFRAALWVALCACIGSVIYVLTYEGFLDILTIYIYLGYALSISLPVGILAGLLIRFLAKKNLKPALLNWPIWGQANHMILWATKGIRKRIGNHPIPKIVGVVVLAYGIFFAFTYLLLTLPSDRELWRITDYHISDPMIVNDLFIFNGHKDDRSVDCDCLYAVDKSTGEIVWSTEELAKPYMEEIQRLGIDSSDSFSVGTDIEFVSQNQDTILISLGYRASEYNWRSAIFALRSVDGKILWKVDGLVDYGSFSDSVTKMNQIFVIDGYGDLLAIDSDTGEEIWRQNVYKDFDEDYTWFRFHNDIVVVSTNSSECLTCCCTFKSDEQQYEQFAVYSAETGQPLWESMRLKSSWTYTVIETVNKTLYVESKPWENLPNIEKRDDILVTAIDLETGKKRWELIFQDAHAFSIDAGTTGETLFVIKTYRGGFEDFHILAKIIN